MTACIAYYPEIVDLGVFLSPFTPHEHRQCEPSEGYYALKGGLVTFMRI